MDATKAIRITIDAPRGFGSTTWAIKIARMAKRLGMTVSYIGHPSAPLCTEEVRKMIDAPQKQTAEHLEPRRIEIVDLGDTNG